MRRATSRPANDRRGSVALEFLFLFPLFLGLVLAFVEFTTIIRCEEKLCRASHAGSKAASRGATRAEIAEAAGLALGSGTLGEHSRVEVSRVVRGPDGDYLVSVAHPEVLPPGTPVVVTVEAPTAKVVPNFLRAVGLDLCGEHLTGQTTFLKE